MKVIFFVEYPFGERDYRRFGIETLQENGFEVEVWDFTPVLFPATHRSAQIPDPIAYAGYREFLTAREALNAISRLDASTFIVCYVSYQVTSLSIFRAISKAGLRYALMNTNALPPISRKALGRGLLRPSKVSARILLNALLHRLPPGAWGVKPASVVVAGGERSIQGHQPVSQRTKFVWAHAFDYDNYLCEKQRLEQPDPQLGVFLDEYLPFHPDFVHMGIAAASPATEYYQRLRELFDLLEEAHQVRIVIAAHPRSNYEEQSEFFGGRAVIKGKTTELLHKAGFAIAHASTAINLAVLFNKPVLFVTTDRIQESAFTGHHITAMSTWLGKSPVNLDQPLKIDWRKELTIDENAYARYRESYIKRSNSPEKACWQIVADYLKATLPDQLRN